MRSHAKAIAVQFQSCPAVFFRTWAGPMGANDGNLADQKS